MSNTFIPGSLLQPGPQYPDVEVQLSGADGNAFAIIGKVERALQDGGKREAAADFVRKAYECESYDALLQLAMATVNVT